MPIKNLSDQLRMPRLGKIHLGFRDEKKRGAPTATDYFVCPPEVTAVFGEKPKSLPIYIPTEDSEYWASQYYRAYSQTRGLICKGDGEACSRMLDLATGNIAGKGAGKVAWQEGTCPGRECPLYKEKKCGEMMCLQFMLPDVPGVGVWQVDTGSINSIRNINSEAALIRQICGKINMIPLLLTLEGGELNNPETGKKQIHYFLHLRERETLHKLLDDSRKPLYELLAPPVADHEEAARDIDSLWPEDKPKPDLSERFKDKLPPEKPPAQSTQATSSLPETLPAKFTTTTTFQRPPSSTPEKQQPESIATDLGMTRPEPTAGAVTADNQGGKTVAKRDIATIKTITDMYKACHSDFGLQPADVMNELNITKWSELAITPAQAYLTIAASRKVS